MFKRWMVAALATCLLAAPAGASELTADQVVSKLVSSQADYKDVRITLKGFLVQGPKRLQGEFEIAAIPRLDLRRVAFKAPAQMAGSIVILEKAQASRYVPLTHQVVVSSAAEAAKGGPLDFSKMTTLLGSSASNHGFTLAGVEQTREGKRYLLEAPSGANRMRVTIDEATWRIRRLQVLNSWGQAVAEWSVTDFKADQGLEAASLRALPDDAQVIRR